MCCQVSSRGGDRISDLWVLTPFVSLAVFGLLVTPAGLIRRGKSPIGIGAYAGLAGIVIALVSTIWLGFNSGSSISFGGFQVDLFTYFFAGVLLLVSLFVAISSFDFMKGDPNTAPYFGLLLLSTLGMIVLAASMDLILLYVGWELMSVPTYALTAIRKKDPNSNEAAMKFFVLSALSSALIVYAISLTFGVTGSTNLQAIASSLGTITPDSRSFALMQKSFTRLLAYSSIAQAGYVLIALATPFTIIREPLGLAGGLFHVLNYSIVKTGAFIAAAAVSTRLPVNTLDSFSGLGRRMPQTAFNITIFFLALAGVPPLNGFFSKVMIFTGAVYSPFSWGGYLAVAALINSGFSMSYYGWIIKRMYFDDPSDSSKIPEPKAYTSVMWIATALVFIIGIYPDPWISLVRSVASSL